MQSILGIEHPDFVAYFLKIINLLYTKNLYKLSYYSVISQKQ